MEPEFITYQKFNDPALANDLALQLKEHGIEYFVDEEALVFDPSFAFNDALKKEYAIKIRQADFEKVNELLQQDENNDVDKIGKDYYLYSFTDDELMDVLAKADEWSAFDVVLARKILKEKGKDISDDAIAAINAKRIEELKKPDAPQTGWIVIGYILALLGGILGIFIGWHLANYKKTLPDGERVYDYTETDRKHGKRIFYLAILVLTLTIIYRLSGIFTDN